MEASDGYMRICAKKFKFRATGRGCLAASFPRQGHYRTGGSFAAGLGNPLPKGAGPFDLRGTPENALDLGETAAVGDRPARRKGRRRFWFQQFELFELFGERRAKRLPDTTARRLS